MITSIPNFLLYLTVRGLLGVLALVPHGLRTEILAQIIRVGSLPSSYRKISLTNLKLAFPDKGERWRQQVVEQSFSHLALVISDFVRLPKLTKEWVKVHVEFPYLERYLQLKKEQPHKGIVVATGHLGSFELMAFIIPLVAVPISFVVRNFKIAPLDRWWSSVREMHGNKVISRKGAYREMVRDLKKGRDVGVLFDQNVKRRQGVFVKWFGNEAATSKSVALAALETESVVVVSSLQSIGGDRYRMNVVECDFSELYSDLSLSRAEKVHSITQTLVNHYENMIRQYPEGWFWMHRRWKTRPSADGSKFYS